MKLNQITGGAGGCGFESHQCEITTDITKLRCDNDITVDLVITFEYVVMHYCVPLLTSLLTPTAFNTHVDCAYTPTAACDADAIASCASVVVMMTGDGFCL